MTRINSISVRVLKWLVGLELAYLLLVNSALHLDLTQDLVNRVRPDKFHVSWERAWSWYPFRVNARGIIASGQSRSQQWQVQADAATGSIRLLPLLLKRVYLSSVHAQNVDYRQRPRLKPDRDYTDELAHFPAIRGREIAPADMSPRKNRRPWRVYLSAATAAGQHSFWIYNLKGTGSGSFAAELEVQTRGGPFSLDASAIDLQLGPAYVNGDTELYRGGKVSGTLGFAPFLPREHQGLRMLPYLSLDTNLDLQVGNLGFLNLFTSGLGNLRIGGAGKVQGRLALRGGYMRAGTALTATADALSVLIRDMDVSGKGRVYIHTPAEADTPMGMDINYDALTVTRLVDVDPFLAGDSLALSYRGSNFIAADPDRGFRGLLDDRQTRQQVDASTLDLRIDDATLLDMAIINDYLPKDMPLKFTGGLANLQADLFIGVDKMNGLIELDSSNARLAVDDQRLRGDVDADLVVANGVPREFKVDMSGSRIVLDQVGVDGTRDSFSDDDWSAALELLQADAVLQPTLRVQARGKLRVSDTRPLVTLFQNRGRSPRWISELITLKDLEGEGSLALDEDRVLIPYAYVTSDKAEVATKAVFSGGVQHSLVYARYRKLDVLLRTEGNERDLAVINVREKFEQYSPPLD